jgi:hypothetical protein
MIGNIQKNFNSTNQTLQEEIKNRRKIKLQIEQR